MSARILAIETAAPPFVMTQRQLWESVFQPWYAKVPDAESLFMNTTVERRHMSWDPVAAIEKGIPTTAERMQVWETSTLTMGRRINEALFARIDRDRIGHSVMATCTGYNGPTPELVLAGEFGLPSTLRRTFIGHMGCYAAFNVIKVALDSIIARPDELVLANCTETCSLHLRPEASREQVVTHALFGDASASMILGAPTEEAPGPVIVRTHTETVYETGRMMTWNITDTGFRMTLSPYVPFILCEKAPSFVDALCAPAGVKREQITRWGIHPGGPKIVDLIGETLGLSDETLAPSRRVLANYGNCSSATILLVLREVMEVEKPTPGEYGVFMAFGPGLTMESMLVRF
ncbi:MAG: type III polyketide synthase [Myxococcales bacterium]|nr:type III polyketide synthase [Myxococcales bacterium]